jgi:nitroreductase
MIKRFGGITMNEIYTRVSVRKFEDRPVEPEKITQLLKAAMQAPSAGNQQPWEFFVVTDKDKIEALSKISPYAACAKNAPAVIVPCYRTEGLRWNETVLLDLSCATENLLLEAVSLGLGSVWLCAAPLEDRMAKAEAALGNPNGLQPFAVIPVGYPAETKEQQNRFDERRIHYL